MSERLDCGEHACIAHELCREATRICGCAECKTALNPCPLCGATDHERIEMWGMQIQGCPQAPVDRPVMFSTMKKDESSPGFRYGRPPREMYVRVARPCGGSSASVEPGVEFRDGDSFSEMSFELYDLCFRNDISGRDDDPLVMAKTVEKAIVSRWPDRAYFVEVHSGQGWIQIFQPFGVPRNP